MGKPAGSDRTTVNNWVGLPGGRRSSSCGNHRSCIAPSISRLYFYLALVGARFIAPTSSVYQAEQSGARYLVAYPLLRVQIEPVKKERTGSLPPSRLRLGPT